MGALIEGMYQYVYSPPLKKQAIYSRYQRQHIYSQQIPAINREKKITKVNRIEQVVSSIEHRSFPDQSQHNQIRQLINELDDRPQYRTPITSSDFYRLPPPPFPDNLKKKYYKFRPGVFGQGITVDIKAGNIKEAIEIFKGKMFQAGFMMSDKCWYMDGLNSIYREGDPERNRKLKFYDTQLRKI